MDQRIHDRLPVVLQVRVTDLATPDCSASGDAIDLSKSGIGVYLPLQFMPGTSVQLNIKDTVLFGFVAYACPERSFFPHWHRSGAGFDWNLRAIATSQGCARRSDAEPADGILRSPLIPFPGRRAAVC